ncbi:MAG: YajQ family cyclic di-GMP-binding protein [Omnitrophica bacterium RBG_13_46_9]|nr:MAG: YajQ family cyclic di-GMP-binding protein [Omnitrophica bacterium RBG_13_46_9]
MAKESFSFDIVSEADLQEVDNAVNQAKKELAQRFDFKGSKSSIEYDRDEKKIKLVGDNDFKLSSVKEILAGKLVKRGVSLKLLTFKEPQKVFGGCLEQTADLASGIPHEKAKELVKIIKGLGLKVQAQIEGEKIRVFSPKKDDLQSVISHLRKMDFPLALTFCNYR